MPIFEYTCKKCDHTFDHLARTLADKAETCPKCGTRNPVKQLSAFSAPASSSGNLPCSTGACPAPTCATGACPF